MPAVTSPLSSDKARNLLKALADPRRLQILEALANGERCVCDLTSDLGLAQSRLSFHLKVLKQCGLLSDRQSGRWVYYRLQPEVIQALQGWLETLIARSQSKAINCLD
jgi:ArsR family transcriptional regulator